MAYFLAFRTIDKLANETYADASNGKRVLCEGTTKVTIYH